MEPNIQTVVHWFKMDCLRLDDNPAFNVAVRSTRRGQVLRAILILDPWFRNNYINRGSGNVNVMRFFLECLSDLDKRLRQKYGTELKVFHGHSEAVIQRLIMHWNIIKFTFQSSTFCPSAVVYDAKIKSLCLHNRIEVYSLSYNSLYDPFMLLELCSGEVPGLMDKFLHILQTVGQPNYPVNLASFQSKATTELASMYKEVDEWDGMGIPTLQYFGFLEEEALYTAKWIGGETVANNRFAALLECCVVDFDESSERLMSLDYLSPYLRFGSLSVRRLFYQLHQSPRHTYDAHDRIGAMIGGLLQREFALFLGCFVKDIDAIKGNNLCIQIPWEDNIQHLTAFRNGITGYPWIDAIVRQIRKEGWTAIAARNTIALFLTLGYLKVSWVYGKEFFQEFMLDFELSVSSLRWMQISGSGITYNPTENHDPVTMGKIMDPEGKFIKTYVPELNHFPVEHIHTPWTAPREEQIKSGCIVGMDYAEPIVDPSTPALNQF